MIDSLKLLMVKNKEFYSFLKKQFGITPNNTHLYEAAFSHRGLSFALPDGSEVDNERLEFLGDAIIDAVIADFIFRRFPGEREGFLTRLRAKIVNRAHLDSIAGQMGLAQVVASYASGVEPMKKRICGDTFEALIGAMYLDHGYEKTYRYITEYVLKNYVDIEHLAQTETDFKSRIIEWGQKHRLRVRFETLEECKRPDNSSHFSTQITISGVPIAKGSGQSKKEAEQMASQKALTLFSSSTDISADAIVNYLDRIKKQQQNMFAQHYVET